MKFIELTASERMLVLANQWLSEVSHQLWPGWTAAEAPIAVYRQNERVLLVDHPAPPTEFVPVETDLGPMQFFGGNHPSVRGCTNSEIAGVQTACLMRDSPAEAGEEAVTLIGLLIHEKFHCFQATWGGWDGIEANDFNAYPREDATNNALCQVENLLVADTDWRPITARTRAAIASYRAVRDHRRKRLEEQAIGFE
ncbi:MAG: hypothetical protein AB1331_09765 [Bacillota bacterium]